MRSSDAVRDGNVACCQITSDSMLLIAASAASQLASLFPIIGPILWGDSGPLSRVVVVVVVVVVVDIDAQAACDSSDTW